jgi:hypothetical protein
MLFPIKPATEAHREEEAARISASGQVVDPALWYTKQSIRAFFKLLLPSLVSISKIPPA